MTKKEFVARQMWAARQEALLTWRGMHEGNCGEKDQIDWACMPENSFYDMLDTLSFFCSAMLNKKNVRATIERDPDEGTVTFKTYTSR